MMPLPRVGIEQRSYLLPNWNQHIPKCRHPCDLFWPIRSESNRILTNLRGSKHTSRIVSMAWPRKHTSLRIAPAFFARGKSGYDAATAIAKKPIRLHLFFRRAALPGPHALPLCRLWLLLRARRSVGGPGPHQGGEGRSPPRYHAGKAVLHQLRVREEQREG